MPKTLLALCLLLAACGSAQTATAASRTGDRCAAKAGHDPAKMSLCLARHHVVLSAKDERLRRCLNHARSGRAVVECMRVAAH